MRVLTDQPDDNDEEIKDDDIVPLDIDEIKKDRKNRGLAAVALRVDGANYSQIARILGYSNATTAARAVERVLAESAGEEEREQMRMVSGRRLEKVLRATMKRATDENDPEQLKAAQVTLMVIDRHIRLYGQDAPSMSVVYNPSAKEIESWIAEASKHVREVTPEEADYIEGEVVYEDWPEDGEDD